MGWFDFMDKKKGERERQIRELVVRAGKQHGNVKAARTLGELAVVYDNQGRYHEAELVYREAAKIDAKYGDGTFVEDYIAMAEKERAKTATPGKTRSVAAGFIMIFAGMFFASFGITGFAIGSIAEKESSLIGIVLFILGILVLIYSRKKE